MPRAGATLFEQYICDAYSRAEAHDLHWIRTNQAALRVERYQGLFDAMQLPDFKEGETKVGKLIVLPSSYAGSPRAMAQNYLDAMSIVRRLGKPDYFATMTASPGSPEIFENLKPNEK